MTSNKKVICIRFLILFEYIISEFLYYRIITFLQWQAFTAHRSASSGPMENVLTINNTIEILSFIILFILDVQNKKYWFYYFKMSLVILLCLFEVLISLLLTLMLLLKVRSIDVILKYIIFIIFYKK